MGWGRRYLRWGWRNSIFNPVPPKATPAMATRGGVTHRLRWLDRNAGFRMGCSCGWADAKVRWTQNSAVLEGNRHVRRAQRGVTATSGVGRGRPATAATEQYVQAASDAAAAADQFASVADKAVAEIEQQRHEIVKLKEQVDAQAREIAALRRAQAPKPAPSSEAPPASRWPRTEALRKQRDQ